MMRNGKTYFAWPLILLILSVALLAAPAEAQLYRLLGVDETDGEPTDPDGALRQLGEHGIDLSGSGLQDTTFESQAEEDAWWQRLLNLMIEWGLLEEDTGR